MNPYRRTTEDSISRRNGILDEEWCNILLLLRAQALPMVAKDSMSRNAAKIGCLSISDRTIRERTAGVALSQLLKDRHPGKRGMLTARDEAENKRRITLEV